MEKIYRVQMNAKGMPNFSTAEEVVMCKDCKYKYQEPWHNGVRVEGECEIWQRATLADDFCSYGERSDT